MKPSQAVQTFTDRYPFVGPTIWILSIQYYIIQVVAARAWTTPFSLRANPISDLANTACGQYAGRYVCSPLHGLMNASFIMLGITMAIGSLLIYQEFSKSNLSRLGFSFMALAGLGTLIVGLFTENAHVVVHSLGAALPFFIGNVGLVILGFALDIPPSLKLYTLFSGFVSLLALVFFGMHQYLGLGFGGLERVVAYPQTMWLIVFGAYISSNHLRERQ